MTKEITKAHILQQIQDKLGLREFEPDNFLFSEMVVPVYNIAPHLEERWNKYAEVSITAATAFQFYTVPGNESWVLRAYDVIFMGAGGYTVSGVYIKRVNRDPSGALVYMDLKAGQSVSYHVGLPSPVPLSPGDEIKVNIDGYTSTQDLRLYIDYTVEKIR